MASASTLPPPPGADSQAPPSGAPTTPPAAAPASAQPGSPNGTSMAVEVARGLIAIAKAFPGAAPGVAKINDILRSEVMPALMQHTQPGEPAAPPTNG